MKKDDGITLSPDFYYRLFLKLLKRNDFTRDVFDRFKSFIYLSTGANESE